MPSDEDMMCGNGTVCQWRKALNGNKPGREKDEDRGKRHSWSKSGRGRHGERRRRRGRRWLLNGNHQQQHHPHPRRVEQQQQAKPRDAVVVSSLRPVNIKGNRARGMRAPRNTNQFLMHEKYQLMHMRSDSIGTDASGSGSDSDAAEFILTTDMDSYLGALENARGALLDGAAAPVSRPPPTTTPPLVLDSCLGGALLDAAAAPDSRPPPTTTTPLLVLGSCLGGGALLDAARAPDSRPPPTPLLVLSRQQQVFHHQEDSMQYFPSEDDVIQSEDFMQKDFIDFCGTLTEHV